MIPSTKSCLPFVLVLLALAMQGQPCFAFRFSRWTVRVFNDMKNGEMLSIHCKSKDDDLGLRYLDVRTQFTWSFRENLWSSTLFWCYIRNQDDHVSLEVFNAYEPNLYYRCKSFEYIWSIREDGIYVLNKAFDNQFELIGKWESGW